MASTQANLAERMQIAQLIQNQTGEAMRVTSDVLNFYSSDHDTLKPSFCTYLAEVLSLMPHIVVAAVNLPGVALLYENKRWCVKYNANEAASESQTVEKLQMVANKAKEMGRLFV